MNSWADKLADDHTAWELDQTFWEASLVPVYPAYSSSVVVKQKVIAKHRVAEKYKVADIALLEDQLG